MHISNDQANTQSITISAPIISRSKLNYILGVSISAQMLRDRIMLPLKNSTPMHGASFYLIDRHAHVIASSSGKNIYSPIKNKVNDENDIGNLRNYEIFKSIKWLPDVFEKGNSFSRNTFSWDNLSLKKVYHAKYTNVDNIPVIATFLPISAGNDNLNLGILIESPISSVLAPAHHLQKVLLISSCLITLVLLILFVYSIKNFLRLENAIIKKENEYQQITTQIAHDIQSPISSLTLLIENLQSVGHQEISMMRNVIQRMKQISSKLLHKAKKSAILEDEHRVIEMQYVCLYKALHEIVEDKKFEFSKSLIKIQMLSLTKLEKFPALIDLSAFKSTISNLINNSVDSIQFDGEVKLAFIKNGENAVITIEDNGAGIPKDVLSKLGTPGLTYNKRNGNGYGIFYAKSYVSQLGGTFSVESSLGVGTKITIILPIMLDVSEIVLIDDDEIVRSSWEFAGCSSRNIISNICIASRISKKY